jgi:hypothetical protein
MSNAIDLTIWVNRVLEAGDLDSKKTAMIDLIENSHAKKETKTLFKNKVVHAGLSGAQLDKMAYNYMLSGEGMKVR